jgi:acyl-CoA synthetase (AMP-forming)/AMP-acid ligase II
MSGNIYHWLTANVERSPNSTAVAPFTWAELAQLVGRIRGGLRVRGIRPGDRVALSLPNGPELVAGFLAVAGEAAIPVVLPTPRGRRDSAYVSRVLGVWSDCAPVVLVESAADLPRRQAFSALSRIPAVVIDELERAEPISDDPRDVDQPVFLQYTSGSTKSPRGVVASFDMVAANCRQAGQVYGDRPDDVVVSWVPLYHDMGLVTAVLRPLYAGYAAVLQQPGEFVADPLSWLSAIHDHRGTLASAPNFAFAHCVRRIDPALLNGLDLSCWRVARNAGEVVRPDTMDAFTELLSDTGFPDTAFCPSYGMAEATLTVATTTTEIRPARLRLAADQLSDGGAIVPDPAGKELLSSGIPLPDTTVRVAGPGEIGELLVDGPQVAASYFRSRMPRTADGDLRTGDLGFVHDGHVFVLGRFDDVLVVNGTNYFQQDLVAACATVPGIRPGRIAAFFDEQVVILAESVTETEHLPAQVRARVLDDLGLVVGPVVCLAPGRLPVTTSGKIRVSAAHEAWRRGEFDKAEVLT